MLRIHLDEVGGLAAVRAECQTLIEYHGNKYLPLLLPLYPVSRAILFKIARTLHIHALSTFAACAFLSG
ncbi:MAG: hypothetical protein H0X24_11360 [Ktedonobacterales bacterium]|nr:hypothetical protein [Ktedonobacterales bacterium]